MKQKDVREQFACLLSLSEFALSARREKIARAHPDASENEIERLYSDSLIELPSHRGNSWFRERKLLAE